MFANRLRITLCELGESRLVPRAWLDQFFMRNFTGLAAFDETLVVGDGLLEAGLAVAPDTVQEQFQKWLRGRKMISSEARLLVERADR